MKRGESETPTDECLKISAERGTDEPLKMYVYAQWYERDEWLATEICFSGPVKSTQSKPL